MEKKLYLIGIGTGNKQLLTVSAKEKIEQSKHILTTDRIATDFGYAKGYSLSEIETILQENESPETTVLVSGDVGFFSLSKQIMKQFSSQYEIECINGISSMQYFMAKQNKAYDGCKVVSMHGRAQGIVGAVSYNPSVFVLTGGTYKVGDICRILTHHGLGFVTVCVGENLSYAHERIVTKRADELVDDVFDDLSVMLIENEQYVNPWVPLSDEAFVRGRVPMTKEEVRAIVLAKLKLQKADIVYDIGAGTGSLSVEMARRCQDGFVYAIEKEEDAIDLLHQNRQKHGAYNMEIIHGTAPDALATLPPPDAAFIGGSGGNLKEIIEALVSKNKEVTIVLTAIALQTLVQSLSMPIDHMDVVCVTVAKAKKLGAYDMMMGQNPVYVITYGQGLSS